MQFRAEDLYVNPWLPERLQEVGCKFWERALQWEGEEGFLEEVTAVMLPPEGCRGAGRLHGERKPL